jgi:predicted nucleic acid-binding protein
MIELEGTRAIVTPVRIEFICGAQSSTELELYEFFLEAFDVIDEGRILQDDWKEALRIARRVPRSGRKRQLGDCLIAAIARRLNWEVMTDEIGFPK